MKILIIDADSILLNKRFNYGDIVPRLQIGYVLSLLEMNNLDYYFLDCRFIDEIENSLSFYKSADIIVIFFNTYDYKFAFKLANYFKDKIVVGIGPHASALPSTIIYEDSPFG